jgi:hypothetical protein
MAFAEPMKCVKLFRETTMSIEMPNTSVEGGNIMVNGRADWSLGYSSADGKGALLVAIEAKKRPEFLKGEATFNINEVGGLRMVFSFMVAVMETAMKSTPNATP